MQKKIVLTILSVLALVACGGTTGSETSSSSNESSNSSEEVKDWNLEQKEVMKKHLYGEVLPYIELGEKANVHFVSANHSVQIHGLDNSMVNQEILETYAASYTTDDGWVNVTDQVKSQLPVQTNYYVIQKQIELKNGEKKFVQVQFYAYDSTSKKPSPEGNGAFVLVAFGDSTLYDFLSDFFDAQTQLMGSNVKVPAFPATTYLIPDSQHLEVYCYTTDTKADITYKGILEEAKFVVSQVEDQYGPYYLATSPDKKYAVGFEYSSGYKILDIFLAYAPASQSNFIYL